MAGLIRILLIFFLFMLVARLIRRFVFPLLFKKATDRMKRDMEERMRAQRDMNDTRREGEVRVEKGQSSASKGQKVEEGEYVDYEEVD